MPVSIKHLTAMLKEPAKFGPKQVSLLAEWAGDQLYYMVKLLKTDEVENKSLVRFEDGTEHWICNLDLHLQFDANLLDKLGNEDIICCVCDEGKSEKPNQIVMCDICQQGYHQECHQPALLGMNLDDEEEWACDTCKHIWSQQQQQSQTKIKLKLKPKPKPKATPKSKPKSEPKQEREPEPEPAPKNEPKPGPVRESESKPEPDGKTNSETEPKPEPKPQSSAKASLEKTEPVATDDFVERILKPSKTTAKKSNKKIKQAAEFIPSPA